MSSQIQRLFNAYSVSAISISTLSLSIATPTFAADFEENYECPAVKGHALTKTKLSHLSTKNVLECYYEGEVTEKQCNALGFYIHEGLSDNPPFYCEQITPFDTAPMHDGEPVNETRQMIDGK